MITFDSSLSSTLVKIFLNLKCIRISVRSVAKLKIKRLDHCECVRHGSTRIRNDVYGVINVKSSRSVVIFVEQGMLVAPHRIYREIRLGYKNTVPQKLDRLYFVSRGEIVQKISASLVR